MGKVKEEGGRVMGSKCAVQNLGQSGRSTFFSFSVWSSVTLMSIKLCSHMTVHLSSPLKVSDFSVSHVRLSQSRVVSPVCGCRLASASISSYFLLPFFPRLPLLAFTVAYTVH